MPCIISRSRYTFLVIIFYSITHIVENNPCLGPPAQIAGLERKGGRGGTLRAESEIVV